MFKSLIGVDIGSKFTKLALKEGCAVEPTLIAACAGERSLRAVGNEAEFTDYGRVAPIKSGCCANVKLLSFMLEALNKRYGGKRAVPRNTELFCALPRVMSVQRMRAFEKAAIAAGFHGFHILERSLMGAIGAGVDIQADRISMIVDIGAQTVSCAAVGFGGIIYECSESFGSELCDRAIQNYFAAVHRVQIGGRVAELIKMNLDKLGFTVDGRSVDDGLPRTVNADTESLRLAASGGAKCLAALSADMLSHLPPEACADILDTGIVLIGGGAKMYGIDKLFENATGISTVVAENAETAAADGMRTYIFLEKGSGRAVIGEYPRDAILPIRSVNEAEDAMTGF